MQKAVKRIVVKYFYKANSYKRRLLYTLMCGESLNHPDIFKAHFR